MTDEQIGVTLSRDVRLIVQWDVLAKTLAKVAVQGLAGAFGLPTAAGAVGTLTGAFDAIKAKEDPGSKAWQLFALGLAWAMDQLRQEASISEAALAASFKQAFKELKESIADQESTLTTEFLERPSALPLFQRVRDQIAEAADLYRPDTHEDASVLRRKIDAAFDRGVFEVWSRQPATYQLISDALQAPGSGATSRRMEWETYRRVLIADFEVTPIFGQDQKKISLSQLYVPLRATWNKKGKAQTSRETATKTKPVVVSLDETLDDWVFSSKLDDIRLIGGGPGSGKSTSMKSLARRLAEDGRVRPLYIPLQHIDIGGDLRAAIDHFFTSRSDSAFRNPPLSRDSVESGAPLVLIFDGLDELAKPGSAADELASLFVSKLMYLVNSLQGGKARPLKVVLAGRMASFQSVGKHLSIPDDARLEVHGYAPTGDTGLASDDQRTLWWERYASTVGLPTAIPAAFNDRRLTDITTEPLLCYLLVLSGMALENWERAAENQNVIFEKLINEVWERGWGDGSLHVRRQGPGKSLSQSDFNRLMETFALAAWLGGDTKICGQRNFEETVPVMQCEAAWANFVAEGGDDITNLAMNFYLKATDDSHKGFEFTHKSFGDYLAARALVGISLEAARWVPRRVDVALTDWIRATSTGELTTEIQRFLRDELRLMGERVGGAAAIAALKSAFENLADATLREGLAVQITDQVTWRAAEKRQRNAELLIWAVLNASFRAQKPELPIENRRVKIDWPEKEESFKKLILRLASDYDPIVAPVHSCFSGIIAPESNLFSIELDFFDFDDAFLDGCNFSGSFLLGASFRRASLRGAYFIRSNVGHASFNGADVHGAVFANAVVNDSNLLRESSGEVVLSRTSLVSMNEEQLKALAGSEGVKRIKFKSRYVGDDDKKLAAKCAVIEKDLAPVIEAADELREEE